MRHFRDLLEARWSAGKFICVGLDSDKENDKWPQVLTRTLPAVSKFNGEIVRTTAHTTGSYKPNIAFYEQHGAEGLATLHETIKDIHDVAPKIPVILDAKRADIGNTNRGYVQMAFDWLGVDGITLHSYLGYEAMQPFLDREEKLCIILCRTSNPGAGELQDLQVEVDRELWFDFRHICVPMDEYAKIQAPLYQVVASRVNRFWNKNKNCGLVVGATYPEELKIVRGIVGDDMNLLIPGVGKGQGGDLAQAVRNGANREGRGMIINASREIIFASSGEDFAEAAGRKAEELNTAIQQEVEEMRK